MKLDIIMLIEISQDHEGQQHVFSSICGISEPVS